MALDYEINAVPEADPQIDEEEHITPPVKDDQNVQSIGDEPKPKPQGKRKRDELDTSQEAGSDSAFKSTKKRKKSKESPAGAWDDEKEGKPKEKAAKKRYILFVGQFARCNCPVTRYDLMTRLPNNAGNLSWQTTPEAIVKYFSIPPKTDETLESNATLIPTVRMLTKKAPGGKAQTTSKG